MTAVVFCSITFVGSIISTHLSPIWYGMGVVAGSFAGWTMAYARLRWIEKYGYAYLLQWFLDSEGKGPKPSAKAYDRSQMSTINVNNS